MARGSRGWIAAGATLATCALLPPVAGAAENGLIYVEASGPITSGQPTAVDASCPGGTHLVGAGGDSVEAGFSVLEGVLNSVTPLDGGDQDLKPDDIARVYAFNTTASPGETRAWAICAAGRTVYRSHTSKLREGHAATAKARCRRGTNVVGGGNYITGANDDATLQATRPFDGGDADHKPDDGWRVKAFNLRDGRKDLTAYAMCRKERPKYLGGFGGFSPPSGGGGGAVCNDKDLSVSGPGAEVGGDPSLVRITAYYPDDIGDPFEAGDVPDDYVIHEAENATTAQVPDGSFAACLNLAQ
jgi:hypothetical protein